MNDYTIGFLYVLGAVIGWGCYGLPLKYWKVTEINPLVLQFYFSIAVFASCWLILLEYEFRFTYLGFIGAALWANANMLSFLAIKACGLAIAQGTWNGMVIIVSFLWGAVYFHEPIGNLTLVIIGLCLIFLGIICISSCDTQIHHSLPPSMQFLYRLNWIFAPEGESSSQIEEEMKPILTDEDEPKHVVKQKIESHPVLPNYHISTNRLTKAHLEDISHQFFFGVILAAMIGFAFGCSFVPMKFLPSEFEGKARVVYVISFSIGVMIIATVYLFFYLLYVQFYEKQDWKSKFNYHDVGPALIGGLLWSVANYCGTFVIIYLGMAIGFPLAQSSIVISGLVGIFILHEITRMAAIFQFFIGSAIVLGGCAVLAVFGSA